VRGDRSDSVTQEDGDEYVPENLDEDHENEEFSDESMDEI